MKNKKNVLLTGTLILTFAGLLTRVVGFFYKIYLSNTLTAEHLGLYQLIFPIYGICFTLYGSGIQTAISQLVANCSTGANANKRQKKVLKSGIVLSVSIAFLLSVLLFLKSDFIAARLLMEPRCSSSLQVIAIVFPFCGITACINGYYYGLKKTGVPAFTQLLEQIVRVVSVYVIAVFLGGGNQKVTCELAVFGIVLGEIASDLFSLLALFFEQQKQKRHKGSDVFEYKNENPIFKPFKRLFLLACPLTGNRLVVSLLHSYEAVLIPYMLQRYGMSSKEALSVYGILTGMSMPFIMFPSAITNSLSVLILPAVSEAQAANNTKQIKKTAEVSMKYSLLIGIYATCIFLLFGNDLGTLFFHNPASGTYMVILSWLCPFLYLSTMLGSVINGLGEAHMTFFNTVISLGVRIFFICWLVPKQGLKGYLIGLLVSQLVITVLDFYTVRRNIPITINSIDWILKPSFILLCLGFLSMKCYEYFTPIVSIPASLFLLLLCCIIGITYLCFLILTKVITKKDL